MTKAPLAAVALAAAALAAAGCGGSKSTTTTSATVGWATSLCTATTTWQSALQDTASSLKSTPTKAGLQSAAEQVKKATQDYLDALKQLGKPDTQAGATAKTAVDTLQTQLQSGVDAITKATAGVSDLSGLVGAASTVGSALATMATQVETATTTLKGLDPKDELEQAIRQADACATLRR